MANEPQQGKSVLDDLGARVHTVWLKKSLTFGAWSNTAQLIRKPADLSVGRTHLEIAACRAITSGLQITLRKGAQTVDVFVPMESIDTIDMESVADCEARLAKEAAAAKAGK